MPERDIVPRDKVNLRILLINGKTEDFLFNPSTTGSEIAQHIFQNWPSEWDDDAVSKPERAEVLRLIYRGRFLHDTTKLSSLSLASGKTTVMHMILRETLPDEPNTDTRNSQNKQRDDRQQQGGCCVLL